VSLLLALLGAGDFPSTLALTGWWRADWATSPWVGTASAGTSGSHDLTTLGADPGVGTAVNGYDPASLNGSTQALQGAALSSFISAGAWSFEFLIKANSAVFDPGPGTRYGLPNIASDSGAYFVIAFSASGVSLEMADGINPASTLTVACGTGAWHLVRVWYDGTDLWLQVDNATASSETYGNLGSLAGTLQIGRNYDGTAFFDGEILEILTADSVISDPDAASISTYLETRYALTLSAGGGPSALVLAGIRSFARLGREILSGLNALALSGAPSDARIGSAAVTTVATVALSGAPADGRLGRATFAPGTASLALSGANADGRLGSSALTTLTSIAVSGIGADARASSGSITGLYTVALSGLSSDARASSGILSSSYTVSLRGVRAPARASAGSLSTVASVSVVGVRAPARASSGALASFATVAPSGVPVDSRVGRATPSASNALALMGVRGRAVPGSVTTVPGAVAASLSGIATDGRLGSLVAVLGGGPTSTLALSGIRSDALAGLLSVTPGAATIAPRGVYVDARVGGAQVTGLYTVALRGVRARASTGRATITTVATMALSGAVADSRVGAASLATFYTVSLSGVSADGRLGAVRATTAWVLSLSGVHAGARQGSASAAPGPVTVSLRGVSSDGRTGPSRVAITFDFFLSLVGVRAETGFGRSLAYINASADIAFSDHPFTSIHITHAPFAAVQLSDAPFTRITIMADSIYDVGDDAVFTGRFTVAHVPTDPTALTVEVKRLYPVGTTTVYTYGVDSQIAKLSDGVFTATIPCTTPGEWAIYFIGTGAAKGAEPAFFKVRAKPT
jgi:hypothetical protein